MIASVVVDCKTDSVNRTFDYMVPPCFLDTIKIITLSLNILDTLHHNLSKY